MGINWHTQNYSTNNGCPIDLQIYTKQPPLIANGEIEYTLYNQSDKKAYYFSPGENITQAQPIPLCTTETVNTRNLLLLNKTVMCYGVNGDNLVILTKRITGFYGAAETITTPANPVELNPAPTNTPAQPVNATKPTPPDNTNDDEISEQEKAYRELLKKLYLPAI